MMSYRLNEPKMTLIRHGLGYPLCPTMTSQILPFPRICSRMCITFRAAGGSDALWLKSPTPTKKRESATMAETKENTGKTERFCTGLTSCLQLYSNV